MVKDPIIIIITGLSGAGKSTALAALEDVGYKTMDNLPCNFCNFILQNYIEKNQLGKLTKTAVGIDIRSFNHIEEYVNFIELLQSSTSNYEIIYLEASKSTILNRYNLTRRKHPLEENTLLENIDKEEQIMFPVKEKATFVMDTTNLSAKALTSKIYEKLHEGSKKIVDLNVHVQSFGFKYGVPIDMDMIFDVRFLPNPYYIPELREKNGNDKEVQNYVMNSEISEEFYKKLMEMLNFLIPNFIREGKKHLSLGIGCSGGKHRSVTFANKIALELSKEENLRIYISNRENEKGHW